MPAPFSFDRSWWFPVEREELWGIVTRPEAYRTWWPWLRELDVDGFRPGATARAVIRAPLPYSLNCEITVAEMTAPETVATQVSGDLEGPARLELASRDGGTDARLCWTLRLQDPVLSRVALVGRPAMAWAHDRIVELGVEQFRERALGDPA